jgi:hypothetical protein
MGQCSACCGIGSSNSRSEGPLPRGSAVLPQNRRNECNGNVFGSNAQPSSQVMMSAFPNRFTGTSCKAASSFPPQRPARVRVKVKPSSFGSIARGQENQSAAAWNIGFCSGERSYIGPERKYETPNVPICPAHGQVFSSAA